MYTEEQMGIIVISPQSPNGPCLVTCDVCRRVVQSFPTRAEAQASMSSSEWSSVYFCENCTRSPQSDLLPNPEATPNVDGHLSITGATATINLNNVTVTNCSTQSILIDGVLVPPGGNIPIRQEVSPGYVPPPPPPKPPTAWNLFGKDEFEFDD